MPTIFSTVDNVEIKHCPYSYGAYAQVKKTKETGHILKCHETDR